MRAAIAMQIDIAEAVLDDMLKALAMPGSSLSDLAVSSTCPPSASAKDDKAAKGCVNPLVLSLRSGLNGLEIDC